MWWEPCLESEEKCDEKPKFRCQRANLWDVLHFGDCTSSTRCYALDNPKWTWTFKYIHRSPKPHLGCSPLCSRWHLMFHIYPCAWLNTSLSCRPRSHREAVVVRLFLVYHYSIVDPLGSSVVFETTRALLIPLFFTTALREIRTLCLVRVAKLNHPITS